jgi:hypothetical protein
MVKLNAKLKGTTLVETIVSMVLIVLIIAIVIQSLIQVNREVGNDIKPYAASLIKSNLLNPPKTESYTEITDDYSSLKITRNLSQYNNNKDLYVFEVKAINSENHTLASARIIVSSFDIENLKSDEE